MDAQFCPETQPARALRVGLQQRLVFPRKARPVDRRLDARESRGQHQARAEGEQFVSVAFDTELELKVDGAEHQAPYARGGRDGFALRYPRRRLDQREKRDASVAA